MGLKPVPKEDKRIADEKERVDTQALILETAKPPERSVFSRHWKIIAAGAAITGAGLLYGAYKKKSGHQE